MKTKKPLISVVVTAYKRPEYTEQAIKSFLLQTVRNSEMVILDDCVEDTSVKTIVEKYAKKDTRIRYIKNPKRLGYCKNFLKSLVSAKGDYIVTLGDDDIFIDKDALTNYVKIFQKYPDVNYIYSNMVQINHNLDIDYVFDLFAKDIHCKNLECSLTKVWLRSCFIAGIGLRNNIDFTTLYPKDNILFPQVELIGKILGTSLAYANAKRLIGARAHLGQLGNVALSGKDIKGSERHSVYELNMIFDRVMHYYDKKLNQQVTIDRSFVNSFFETNHKAIFANEKISTGNASIIKTYFQALKNNPAAIFNLKFTGYFLVVLFLPKFILFRLKEYYKRQSLAKYKKIMPKLTRLILEIKNV